MLAKSAWEDLNRDLDYPVAVDAFDIAELPDGPGLYAIWQSSTTTEPERLLYVGKSRTVQPRVRIVEYLSGKRPNETLYLHVLNQIIRPDMNADSRNLTEIAIEFLERCEYAVWVCADELLLSGYEARAHREGIRGRVPVLNRPASKPRAL